LNANILEIKQRAQRGMTFLILTYTFIITAKKLNFFGEKMCSNFCQKLDKKAKIILLGIILDIF